MKKTHFFFVVLLLLSLFYCDTLEKEIEIDLPDAVEQYVVESYVTPGESFYVSLSKSSDFFTAYQIDTTGEELAKLFVNDAQVSIITDERTIRLDPVFVISPKGNISNYYSPEVMRESETELQLEINLTDGKSIHANAKLLPKIEFDSLVIEGNGAEKYRMLTYLTDPNPDEVDYFRRILYHKYTNEDGEADMDTQDFGTSDELSDTEKIAFGSGYYFSIKDTVINELWHLEEPYYEFLRSVSGAYNASISPFGQPGRIFSNMEEDHATGIFTAFYRTIDTTILTPNNVPQYTK